MILETNPKRKRPAYQEDAFVILKKDYTEIHDYCRKELTKGAVWTINVCGCSKYAVEFEEGKVIVSTVSDDEEWCFISKTLIDDYDEIQGCVRAKDLKLLTNFDIESTTRW